LLLTIVYKDGQTLLHVSVIAGYAEVVSLLLAGGIEVNANDNVSYFAIAAWKLTQQVT
jgi:ankyrin repeat protein